MSAGGGESLCGGATGRLPVPQKMVHTQGFMGHINWTQGVTFLKDMKLGRGHEGV